MANITKVEIGKMTVKLIKRRYAVELEALPDDPRPPEIRLRQILKLCLRGFKMRCTEVREVTPTTDSQISRKDDRRLPGSVYDY